MRILRIAAPFLVLLASCTERRSGETVDDLGRRVALPQQVSRVITLAPALTEIVHAIGSEALLAGTDDYSDFPPQAAALPKVGGMEPSRERIAQLDPDLVLASTSAMHPQLAVALESMDIALYAVRTDRLHEVAPAISRIGEILGSPRANDVRVEFERRMEAERRTRSSKPRVLFVIFPDPLYVAVPETHLGDLLALTGVVNVAAAGNQRSLYSREAVVANPPDMIFYPGRTAPPDALVTLLNARREGRPVTAHSVDEDLFMRPGPRLPEAAAAINRIVDEWERMR
ncbi:MAG TPA: helical backbone metal receptor [Thermoanaerobaculia bacterium]|nr:helical backbone metal receptor [Thermoanaerobaculia bacterium]